MDSWQDLPPHERERWSRLSASVISDCMNRTGVMRAPIRRLAGQGLVGAAYPVHTVAGDNRTLHLALTRVPRGAVLVVDAEGFEDRAVWGEVLTVAAERAGVVGIVVDGSIRDLREIRERGFPVYARGVIPAGPHKGWVGEMGGTISCAGVVVAPGDVVVGDADGVVVVPRARTASVLNDAERRENDEREWIRRIEGGEMSASMFGLNPDDRDR